MEYYEDDNSEKQEFLVHKRSRSWSADNDVSNDGSAKNLASCRSSSVTRIGEEMSVLASKISDTAHHMADKAHQMADKAEEIMYQVWNSVHLHSLPDWLRSNDFLICGHRPQLHTFKECFLSIFRLHTETVNIWTHLIGFVAFIVITTAYMQDTFHWQEKLVMSFFLIGAIVCLGLSWTYHTVHCHSPKIGSLFSKLDYCGITVLVVGSAIPFFHYSFYCSAKTQAVYISMMVILGVICIAFSLVDKFDTPECRPIRAGMFLCLGLSGVVPLVHYVAQEGFWHAWTYLGLSLILLMAVLYITGTLIYAFRVPERFFPGVFDIWCQSHQIFHVFVVAAALVHYVGVLKVAQYRLQSGNCISSPMPLIPAK